MVGTCAWFRRRFRSRRIVQTLALIFLVWNAVEALHIRRQLLRSDVNSAPPPVKGERIFIASLHWNNEAILRSHWNEAVIDLAKALGPDNIYISVYESGSWDRTKDALRELDLELDRIGVPRTITLSETTHQDEISLPPADEGWIGTPRCKKELRRIPYLARLRNLTLRPLEEMVAEGITFDKILFLNDVIFTTNDVYTLLNTNDGVYAAACSLDFSKPPRYYDTFALRDSTGHEHVMQTWPFFRSTDSRAAIKNFSPVPVTSCWNGMVSMPADPFVSSSQPLRFRGISDSLALFHLEGSECCLIHADNPLSATKGVYLNPRVRVAYNSPAYDAVHPAHHWLSSSWRILMALWENRLRRWTTTPWFKQWVVSRRVGRLKSTDQHHYEPGEFCLIDEMQVLVVNGWAHV